MGQVLEVEELLVKEVHQFAGKDLIEQDPSPPRPASKRGRQEAELDMPVAGLIGYSEKHPDGQPEGGRLVYVAE